MRTGDHGIEWLADARISRVRSRAEAQAQPVPQQLLRALAHSSDLRAIRQVARAFHGRADALQCLGYRHADPPADLSQPVGELVIAAIGHRQIVSPGATQSQGTARRAADNHETVTNCLNGN